MKKVFWIASREFVATVFTKAFLVGLLFLPIMVGIIFLVVSLMNDDDFRAAGRIAILDHTGVVVAEARQVLPERERLAPPAAGSYHRDHG